MELVKEGYKDTELGFIPVDWQIQKLNELIETDRPIRYGIVQPGQFDIYGRYMVRGQDYSFGWAEPQTLFKVSAAIEERYKNARLKEGDLVLTIVGASTGHVEVVPGWLDGANITQTTARIGIDKEIVNPQYCKYYLESSYGKGEVSIFIKGAAQPGLNIGDVRNFRIIIPTKSEQTAIATALSDIDALISNLEKLIEKKRMIKQGAMQELLKPKDDWKDTLLKGIVCEVVDNRGKTPPLSESGFALLEVNSLGDIYPNLNKVSKYVTEVIYKSWFRNHLLENDLLFSTVGNIGQTSIHKYTNSCIAQNIVGFRFKDANSYFVKYYFEMALSKRKFESITMSGVQPSIKVSQLVMLSFPLPAIQEQNRIASVLSDIDSGISAMEAQLEKYRQVKQGMMQNLLTGKIRLI